MKKIQLPLLILSLTSIFGWFPSALGATTEYQRCRSRLNSVQNKVETITNRFQIYGLERENICLGLKREEEKKKGGWSFYPAEGSVDECASQIFEERDNFRRLREELASTRKSFCESRSKLCPIVSSAREVGEPQTLEECNVALNLRQKGNEALDRKISDGIETRHVLREERERVCGYADFLDSSDYKSDRLLDDLRSDSSVTATPLGICLGNLSYEREKGERRRDRLQQIYNAVGREWGRLCECSAQN